MARALTKIAEELDEAWREWQCADLVKLVRDATETDGYQKIARAARKGGRQDRLNLLKLQSGLGTLLGEKFRSLLREMHEAAEKIANEPLPIGHSTVSKQFMQAAPTNGAQPDLSRFDVPAALEVVARQREVFERGNKALRRD